MDWIRGGDSPDDTLVPELDELPELVDPAPSRPLDAFPTMDTLPASPDTSVLAADAAPDSEPRPEPEPLPEPEAEPEVQAAPGAAQSRAQPSPAAEPAAPEPPPAPQEPAAEAAAGPLGSWVVQVGSFSNESNAVGLRDKLRQGGFTTQVEKVRVSGKTHYRVRVGPFLERDEAEQKRNQLADKFKLSGRVLSYP